MGSTDGGGSNGGAAVVPNDSRQVVRCGAQTYAQTHNRLFRCSRYVGLGRAGSNRFVAVVVQSSQVLAPSPSGQDLRTVSPGGGSFYVCGHGSAHDLRAGASGFTAKKAPPWLQEPLWASFRQLRNSATSVWTSCAAGNSRASGAPWPAHCAANSWLPSFAAAAFNCLAAS